MCKQILYWTNSRYPQPAPQKLLHEIERFRELEITVITAEKEEDFGPLE